MNLDELRQSLLDYDYLQSKLKTTDTETLIAQCELFPDDDVIKLIKYTLRMSSHIPGIYPKDLDSPYFSHTGGASTR
jgi:hypothetical protein